VPAKAELSGSVSVFDFEFEKQPAASTQAVSVSRKVLVLGSLIFPRLFSGEIRMVFVNLLVQLTMAGIAILAVINVIQWEVTRAAV
jgi:hypothetical protein